MNHESDGNNVVHNIIKCYIMVVFPLLVHLGPQLWNLMLTRMYVMIW